MSSDPGAGNRQGFALVHDRPVEVWADDRYGMAPYAYLLARMIAAGEHRPGFIIAVDAPWGTGKTSVVRLAETLMVSGAAGEDCWRHAEDFTPFGHSSDKVQKDIGEWQARALPDPWRFLYFQSWSADRTDLAFELFDRLWQAHNEGRSRAKVYLGRIRRWAKRRPSLALAAAASGASVVVGAFNLSMAPTAPAGAEQKGSPGSEVEALIKWLRARKTPLVFVIDDIDRLRPDQVASLLSALWWFKDLPNVILVLVWDRERVAAALATVLYGGRYERDNHREAEHFLEKLIQASLRLPQVPERKLMAGLAKSMKLRGFRSSDEDYSQETAWTTVETHLLHKLIRTPRGVKQMMNALEIAHLMLPEGSFRQIDLTVVEALRLFDPARFARMTGFLSEFHRDRAKACSDASEFWKQNKGWLSALLPAGSAAADPRGLASVEAMEMYLTLLTPKARRLRYRIDIAMGRGDGSGLAELAQRIVRGRKPESEAWNVIDAIHAWHDELGGREQTRVAEAFRTLADLIASAEIQTTEHRDLLQKAVDAFREAADR